jgi:hypothetical protein
MAKADRVLTLFPSIFETASPYTLLAEVVQALAAPLDEADSHLFRIQRAHRLPVAETTGDILRLAALLNLDARFFEDLLADPGLDYAARLDLMRVRVRALAALHLRGLGTPEAIVTAAALLMNGVLVSSAPGISPLRRLDNEGFSYMATVAFPHTPAAPPQQIVLHENPFHRRKSELAERRPYDSFNVENPAADVTPLRVAIQGVLNHTVMPSIYAPAQEIGLLFYGVIPDGQTLIIDPDSGAQIDGEPVDPWLIPFKGGLVESSAAGRAVYALPADRPLTPWGLPLPTQDLYATAAGAARAARERNRDLLPRPPLGPSTWVFKVAWGVYDGTLWDASAFETPSEPVGVFNGDFSYEAAVYDYPPSAITGMAWDERIGCSFKLLLPPAPPLPLPALDREPRPPLHPLDQMGALIGRFKAAGVRAFLDTVADGWVLGESLLRDPRATEGEGVTIRTTRLVNRNAERLVTFDAGAA